MQNITRKIWIVSVVLASVGALGFLLVAIFIGLGWGGQLGLIFIWFPTVIFIAVSILCIAGGKIPTSKVGQIPLIIFLFLFTFVFTVQLLFQPVSEWDLWRSNRQSYRQRREENIRTTVDGKYEYMLFLRWMHHDNPDAHIAITEVGNEENRMNIVIDLRVEEIPLENERIPTRLLMEMSPTDDEHIYIFTTTPYLNEEIEVFEINLETRTSRRIE